ncbi:pilus assembly protein TadG-related protein [Desulfuribacillus alkaliarsenatis]|uniref:Putative Flp pilus-assembly TadG-like N-terminal domain-containing protein n=1 Tax=Desulfuribacillus alkaliarsenatis TaxID=766136 RepID=A0A1E5G174_9FIRM|nr:Tad domain-containing protein [Desulfuribacillus alkaliarsenatis]OEF96198.1 hypothetical protein BHF68_08500 [Desulfuribacillus alkaliarsenatis]
MRHIKYITSLLFGTGCKNQRGSTLVIVAFALLGLIAMSGLVIDGGTLYVTKSHLQKTANATVLSSAQELTNSNNAVNNVAIEVLIAHQEQESLYELKINMNEYVHVKLQKPMSLPFMSIFGKDVVVVEVEAKAQIATIGGAYGAAPLGIDENIPLQYNTIYKLKVDEEDVDTGNFGILALGGPGANRYEDNLLYGYQNMLSVGDILDTQTGNIAGKTRSSIKQRIDSCPHPVGETYHRNCSRVILVPVYQPYNHHQNQMKEVKITGFAYFYITEPMDSKDTSITGMFIERAGRGTIEAGAVNRGAYAIRLVK